MRHFTKALVEQLSCLVNIKPMILAVCDQTRFDESISTTLLQDSSGAVCWKELNLRLGAPRSNYG